MDPRSRMLVPENRYVVQLDVASEATAVLPSYTYCHTHVRMHKHTCVHVHTHSMHTYMHTHTYRIVCVRTQVS